MLLLPAVVAPYVIVAVIACAAFVAILWFGAIVFAIVHAVVGLGTPIQPVITGTEAPGAAVPVRTHVKIADRLTRFAPGANAVES